MEITKIIEHTNFDETQQEIVSNIARQAFLRGKVEALYNLEDQFKVFNGRYISKDDLIKAFQAARLVLEEGLK